MTYMECEHRHSNLTARTLSNGTTAYYMQCLRCGAATSTAIAKAKAAELLAQQNNTLEFCPPWNAQLVAQWAAQASAERASARFDRMIEAEDRRIEHTNQYHAYLRTPEWQDKRQKVIERCRGICEGCMDARVAHVHHLTYAHIFDELLFELVGLCEACHERAHQ